MKGGDKVMVLSWGGVARHGPTVDARLLFCVLRSSEAAAERAALYAAFRVLAWSFRALAAGRRPVTDHRGKPFTDKHRARLAGKPLVRGLRGAWVELRGDWQYLNPEAPKPPPPRNAS